MSGNRSFGRPSGRPFGVGSSSFEDDDDEPFESDPREAEAARARERADASRQTARTDAASGVQRRTRPAAEPGGHSGAEAGSLSYSRDSRRARGAGGSGRTASRGERRTASPVSSPAEGTSSTGDALAADNAFPESAPNAAPTDRLSERSARQTARAAALGFKRSLRGRALGYLSRREHSRSELARKLAPFVEESDGEQAVEQLLDALGREGWLSDNRFAESVVNRRAARFGAARIVGELKRHKLDGELVQELGAALRETEWTRIQDVWRRKFGSLADTPRERAKQARFLAARGFSRDLIMRVLKVGNDALPDEE